MKHFLGALFGRKPVPLYEVQRIIIVSGLPRSGTSMVMKMLEAGGIPSVTDGLREADSDNPNGYYEFEEVKQLDAGNIAWLKNARGSAVKVISALLPHLPSDYLYDVIFIHRSLEEVLASQKKMLLHRGEDPNQVSDDELMQMFEKHKTTVLSWLYRQPHTRLFEAHYAQLLSDPQSDAEQMSQFLNKPLDVEAMVAVVDPTLYRNRSTMKNLVNANE